MSETKPLAIFGEFAEGGEQSYANAKRRFKEQNIVPGAHGRDLPTNGRAGDRSLRRATPHTRKSGPGGGPLLRYRLVESQGDLWIRDRHVDGR